MEILNQEWRTGRECVGIILVKTATGKLKVYIGVGEGYDEDVDAQSIANSGCRLKFPEAKAFFPTIEEKDFYTE